MDDGHPGRRRGYNVVIASSVRPNPNETLVGNPEYPQIAEDFAKAFATLRTLSTDVFLAVHGSGFTLPEKAKARERGLRANPFIDPQGYRDYITTFEQQYLDKLEADRAGAAVR
jgi:metallo-beta-lactamase class B